jgi:hypothetical protein
VDMDQVRVPFFIRLGDRGFNADKSRHSEGPGEAVGITLRKIEARGASAQPSYVAGLTDAPVRDVVIESCRIEVEGGGAAPTTPVPEKRDGYPSWETFGPLPASVLYLRNVQGLTLHDVAYRQQKPDARPPLVKESCVDTNVEGFKPEEIANKQSKAA